MPYPGDNELGLLSGITTYKDMPDDVFFAIVDEDGRASSIHTRAPGGKCIAMIYYFTKDGKFHGNAGGIVSPTPDPDTRVQVLMIAESRDYSIVKASRPSWLRRLLTFSWTY